MSYRQQVVDRIAYLQAELNALAALVRLAEVDAAPGSDSESAALAAAPAPLAVSVSGAEDGVVEASAGGKVRWKYTAGSVYRIVGPNPFRNGNNYNLFDHLAGAYGSSTFTREQLGAAITQLRASGQIDSVQDEQVYVIVFMRFAGPEKGAVEMIGTVGKTAGVRPARVSREQRASGMWRLGGRPSFHKGSINTLLWAALSGRSFARADVVATVDSLRTKGALSSDRSSDDVARLFMNTVIERTLAQPA